MRIEGSDMPVVTMDAGLELVFAPGANLSAGRTGPGGLLVLGQPTAPVVLRGQGTTGTWNGLRLGPQTIEARLFNMQILDAGSGMGASDAALEMEGVLGADLGGLRIARSGRRGVHAHTGTVFSLVDSTIEDNAGVGVEIDPTSLIDTVAGFGGNVMAQNASPLRMNVDQVVNLDSNVLTGNTLDAITTIGFVARSSGTWQSWGVPYVVENGFDIQQSAVVTMMSGTQLLMGPGQSVTIGGSGPGGLVADGLIVGSAEPNPAAGDWGALIFQTQCMPGSSTITNSTIAFGGHQPQRFGAVEFQGCDGSISDTLISDSAYHGVFVALNTSANVGPNISCSNVAQECEHFD